MTVDKKAVGVFEAEMARAFDLEPDASRAREFFKCFTELDRKMRKLRERLLLRLANHLPDQRNEERTEKLAETWRRFRFAAEEAVFIDTVINDLRRIWPRTVYSALKQPTVDLLLLTATTREGRQGVYAPLPFGYLSFGAKNFPGQVVLGILENWTRMTKCGNPECLAPYFLAKRSTQRYCERGECTRYAVRKKARKWWSENRAKNGGLNAKGSNRENQ